MLAELQIDHMIANKSKALIKKSRQGRTIYLDDQASEENWEDYATELQNNLGKATSLREFQVAITEKICWI